MFQFVLIAAALFIAFPPDDVFASPRPPRGVAIPYARPPLGVAIPGAPSRFRLVKQKKSWDDAEAYCRQSGGHLATFVDLEEYQSVISPLFNMCKNSDNICRDRHHRGWLMEPIWIGAKGAGKSSAKAGFKVSGAGFVQVDGTPFPFKEKGQNPWFGGGVGPTDVNFPFPISDDDKWCASVIIAYRDPRAPGPYSDRGLVVDHALYEAECAETRAQPMFLCEF